MKLCREAVGGADPLVHTGPAGEPLDGRVGGVAVHRLTVLALEDRFSDPAVDVQPDDPGSTWRQGRVVLADGFIRASVSATYRAHEGRHRLANLTAAAARSRLRRTTK